MELEKVIVILSIIVVILYIYRILISTEDFNQIDICDYDSPDPNEFCKSIQKGCTDLIHENKNLNNTVDKNCTTLPTDTRDIIDTAIVCNDTVNKIIMNNYVQKEVCSQIKNYPSDVPPKEINTPAIFSPVQPVNIEIDYYLNGEKGFAPF